MNLDYVIKVTTPSKLKRPTLFAKCVEEKLANSEAVYQRAVKAAADYILSRDNLKVLKTLEREQKKEDKLNAKNN